MKTNKILSFALGVSLLAAIFTPVQVSAASASLSLSGATNSNGTFSAIVYENSGAARVTTAKISLGFSGAVSNVSYDYSVGPFNNPTPSGAYAVQGYVTGSQAVARVSFKMASPGSVTTSAGGSFLKGTNDEGTQVITHSISGGNATFTYSAPVSNGGSTGSTGGSAGGNTSGGSSGGSTTSGGSKPSGNSKTDVANKTVATAAGGAAAGSANNGGSKPSGEDNDAKVTANGTAEVKGDSTKKTESDKKSDDAKKTDEKKTGNKVLPVIILILAGVAAFFGGRYAARYMAGRRIAQAQAEAEAKAKAAAAAAAAKATKPAPKKKSSAKKAKK